ncbi:amidohydrolase [Clostridium peptidivorans]|uniref:amidohydrolase n=1 Tax=Clostridium peptidivorans TaxID=100174 RepID=UPI000BE4591F|nr:amidohydrolase [Clostridium peptidivorans]
MKKIISCLVVMALTLGIMSGCTPNASKIADMILTNGIIYTEDANNTKAEAVAIRDGKIIAVGTASDIEKYKGDSTQNIDLKGKTVMPGFFDGHMHPAMSAVDYMFSVVVSDVTGVENYAKKIKEFAVSHPDLKVIQGAGYYRSDWDEIGPRKETLDAIDSTRPIIMLSNDGHSMWVNSKALEMAGITKDTPNPEGGIIQKNPKTGEPSGLLQESAMGLVKKISIKYSKEQYKEAILWVQKLFNSKGITNIFDAKILLDNPNYYEAYNELANEGKLTLRVKGAWFLDPAMGDKVSSNIDKDIELSKTFTSSYFKVNAFKFYSDQVLEEETGFLLKPYAHRKDNWHGIKVWTDEAMKKAFEKIDAAGFQIHAHSIGDGAAKYTLDILESVRKTNGARDSRHTFAHCQLMTSQDMQRMADMGMTAVVAPYWMQVDDYFWNLYYPYLGKERASHQYPYQSFINKGVNTAIHSDYFVSEPDYSRVFYMAQTRNMQKGAFDQVYAKSKYTRNEDLNAPLKKDVFSSLPQASERVTLDEAIKSSTINGAKQVFEEKNLGSIEIGKSADFAIFDKDFHSINLEEYSNNPVTMTIFEGKVVFDKSKK